MADACTDERHQTWPLFLRAHAVLLEILDHELQSERSLPLTWFDVLVQLASRDDGRLPMHDLADRVLLSKSGVTRLVDRMERAGLIERIACPTDRRVVWAQLTATGRETFDDAAPVAYRGVREHFTSALNANEIEALESGLAKIVAGLTSQPEAQRAAAG
jgi:DNA-binding MarR family transcriptional regulator